jgi:hypothetical protein
MHIANYQMAPGSRKRDFRVGKKNNNMKLSLFTIILAILFANTNYAQIPVVLAKQDYPKKFKIKKDIKNDQEEVIIRKGKKLKIIGNPPQSETSHPQSLLVTVADSRGRQHTLSQEQIDTSKRKISATPIGGAFTFPFKYRPQSGLFEPSLSLSGAVGVHLALDNDTTASISFLGSFGTSSITLNNKNSTDTGTTTRAAATIAFTILGQWDNVQLAISVGLDNNLDNSTDKWIYQSKPWFSLGIGVNIFSKNN